MDWQYFICSCQSNESQKHQEVERQRGPAFTGAESDVESVRRAHERTVSSASSVVIGKSMVDVST